MDDLENLVMSMKTLTEKIQANDFFIEIYFKIIFVVARYA